jgi:TubC N-terminal docking domain
MSLNELLQKLSELSVKLWSEGKNLQMKAPKNLLLGFLGQLEGPLLPSKVSI